MLEPEQRCSSSKKAAHQRNLRDALNRASDHMFHELRKLGYKAAVGWVVRPPAAGDETIYDASMREAGTTGRTEAEIARLQRWRREHNVMWVSEMFRADGINATRPLHDEPGGARTAV